MVDCSNHFAVHGRMAHTLSRRRGSIHYSVVVLGRSRLRWGDVPRKLWSGPHANRRSGRTPSHGKPTDGVLLLVRQGPGHVDRTSTAPGTGLGRGSCRGVAGPR